MSREGVYAFVLFAAVLILAGCLLPWNQLGSLFVNNGLANPDGAIVFVAALIAIAIALYNLLAKRKVMRWALFAVAALGIATAIVDLRGFHAQIQDGALFTVGSGLYVILIGSLLLIVGGALTYLTSDSSSQEALFIRDDHKPTQDSNDSQTDDQY